MMLLFSVTVLQAAAFDVIKVSIYNIVDLEYVSLEIDIATPKTVLS